MKSINSTVLRTNPLLGILIVAALVAPGAASASDTQLEQAIAQGKHLFTHPSFGGNGRDCQSCHLSGGTTAGRLPNGKAIPSLNNAAAIFPRYNARMHKVILLPDQIRSCIANAIQGTPPAYGSDKLNALASYVTSLSQGKPIDMGGKPK
jgi:thiosulfate dehydrogenase